MINWIDAAILLMLLFYGVEGYAIGAIPALLDLLQFSLSFFLGLKFYSYLIPLLTHFFMNIFLS